ncbi:MAG TPA: FYDLN acid domain-containing protein [Myxococcaceae bacterium]|nr:FYDLN acid domain-containing protein [Myxococcaceae bacterium]
MPAKDLGNKYTCFKCSTKFYDMKKPDPICPKCGADQRDSPASRPPQESRRGRLAAVPKVVEPLEPVVAPGLLGDDEEDEETFETETEVAAEEEEP